MIKRKSGAAVAVILSLFAACFSCTRVDDTLGQGLIPDNERMKLKIDTITGINAFLALHDSFPTANLSAAFIGSMQSPEFGITRAGAVMQYTHRYGFEDRNDPNFGIAPRADSLVLYFTVNPTVFGGDTSVVSKFNIYEVKERIFKDSAYFADHDISRTVDLSRVISSFTHKGAENIRLSMTGPNAEDLMRRLLDTTGGVYRSDSLFFNIFKGLYIAPADDSPANAAISTIDIRFASSNGYPISYMVLYARNFTDNTATEVKDTLNIPYSFDNAGVSQDSPIGGFNVFQHDYTGTQIRNLNDTLTTSTPVELGYVQSLGGVTTYLRFTADFVRELKSKIIAPYSSMVVNRAELQLPVNNPTPEVFTKAPPQLGSYLKYGPTFAGIADYNLTYISLGATLPFGGELNHSNGRYALNIASFIQTLANRAEIRDYTFTVGPSVDGLYGFSQVELATGVTPTNPEPLRIILTYTLIR